MFPGVQYRVTRPAGPRIAARWLLLLAGLLLAAAPATTLADVSRELLRITENIYLSEDGASDPDLGRLAEPEFVLKVYELTSQQPLWNGADADLALKALRDSYLEGLNPDDYHLVALDKLFTNVDESPQLSAQRDVLLTDGIVHLARHLVEGKVDPRTLDPSWNYTRRDYSAGDVATLLVSEVRGGRLPSLLASLPPELPFYSAMREALASLRAIENTEQFFTVPDGSVLRPGDRNPSVPAIRKRLAQLNYLPYNATSSQGFDEQMEAAVREFQRDHGIDSDGIIGKQSYAALNITFQQRIDAVRINMDRVRWISEDVSDDFIVVNIAGYELYYARDGELVWETPVMVGTIDTRTPIFQARLQYLEFNPTWNAPRSIVGRSLFGKFKADPGYAERKGYRFYDRSGREVTAREINWQAYSGNSFPYRVVQMPGPDNAMGRVKFMFPNRHAVYLHDTPSRELFSRTQRAFSAGCIRVKNPLQFAEVLLDDPDQWGADDIDALIASRQPQRVVRMQRQVDVMLMYWTVSPGGRNGVQFLPDVYGLDPSALAALDR